MIEAKILVSGFLALCAVVIVSAYWRQITKTKIFIFIVFCFLSSEAMMFFFKSETIKSIGVGLLIFSILSLATFMAAGIWIEKRKTSEEETPQKPPPLDGYAGGGG